MYSFNSRVRYSEVDEKRNLTLYSLVNYFQDCSTFHSEEIGRGIKTEEENKRTWILAAWQICVNRYPMLGEEIQVHTWTSRIRGFQGERNYRMDTASGEVLAYANSLWVYIDITTGKMVRIPKEETEVYICEEPLPMKRESRKILLLEEMEQQESFEVKKYHLDSNHHMNNAQYIRLAREYVAEDIPSGQIRVEYKKQAMLGDMIVPWVAHKEKKIQVALCDEQQAPYAIIEFTEK